MLMDKTGKELAHLALGAVKRPGQRKRLAEALDAAQSAAEVNISIGGGEVELPGWISTDIGWRAARYLDIAEPWPVTPGTVDNIYGDNVIEHLPLEAGRLAFRRMFKALKPGGRLRLATPDAEATARAYLDNDDLAERHLDRHRRKGFEVHHRVDLLRITYTLHGHHAGYIYDEASLRAELEAAGFAEVNRCGAGQSPSPRMRGLEQRHERSESETELILEAVKG